MTTPRESVVRQRDLTDRLLGPEEVAAFLGVPLRTIYRWRSQREGPRGYRAADTFATASSMSTLARGSRRCVLTQHARLVARLPRIRNT